MQYRDLCGNEVSQLGMGIMRMPCLDNANTIIDKDESFKLLDYLVENGVNYFDTACFYHGGNAELFLGEALKRYNRKKVFIATKMPWYSEDGKPFSAERIFEKQLASCNVEYFDYYLVQNVHDTTIDFYLDENNGVLSFLKEQKKKGTIKHLGFSSHASVENLDRFINYTEGFFEFVQLQLNYLDWVLQQGKAKYELAQQADLPVVVMEPLRGGRLAMPPQNAVNQLSLIDSSATPAELSFRWIQSLPLVKVVLSGMNSLEIAQANVKTFSTNQALTNAQFESMLDVVPKLATILPCTGCRYCCSTCPQSLDIPHLLRLYSDCAYRLSLISTMSLSAVPEHQRASNCINCGKCIKHCPQGIVIPEYLQALRQIELGIKTKE